MSERSAEATSGTETNRPDNTFDTRTGKMLSGLAMILGLWILAAPMIFESTQSALWNNVIVGAAIAILAGYNYFRLHRSRLASPGVAAFVTLLGIWSLAVPFVMEMGSEELTWATALAGLVVTVLGGYNAYANRKADATARRTRA